jgi:AcrR family transcriptional regulator
MSVGESPVTEAPSAPARSRAETRRRLVLAGTSLFAEDGLHRATTARIARAAGVATGTFYLHFKDKEALFREIVFEALSELRERQERAAAGLDAGGLADLRARTAELLAFASENRDLIRIVFGRGGESATIGEEVLDAIVPGMERRLTQLAESGELPADIHPAIAAQARAATLTRVLGWWVADPSRASREEVIDTLCALAPVPTGSR